MTPAIVLVIISVMNVKNQVTHVLQKWESKGKDVKYKIAHIHACISQYTYNNRKVFIIVLYNVHS